MPFIPSTTGGNQGFQQGMNMIMAMYGQKKLEEREKAQQDRFNQSFGLQQKQFDQQQKLSNLKLEEAQFKAKQFDEQQKRTSEYKQEVQTNREAGTLTPQLHKQLAAKYRGGIPEESELKNIYAETAAEKRKADLTAKKDFFDYEHRKDLSPEEKEELKFSYLKQVEDYKAANKVDSTPMGWYLRKNKGNGLKWEDVLAADKQLKSTGSASTSPFKAFYNSPEMHGKTSGEIAKLWHEERKTDQIEVSRARYPTRQQVPDVPGMTFDRRSGEFMLPGLEGGVPVAPEDFGLLWAGKYQMAADKSALREITKRNELVKSFATRIEVNSPIIMDLAQRVGNRDLKLLNVPINDLWKRGVIGDGDLAAYKLAVTSLSNELAKLESGSIGIAGASVEQMQIMAEIHNTNLPIAEMQKVIDTGILLSTTLEGALENQRVDILDRIKNWTLEDKETDAVNNEFDIKVKK